MNKDELWQAVLAQIQFNISQASFATWFKNTGIVSTKEGKVIVSVPNNFAKEWLENKYNKIVLKTLHSLDENIREVQYAITRSALKVNKGPETVLQEEYASQLELPAFKVDRETNLNPRYGFDGFVVGPFNELPHAAAMAVSQSPGSVYNPLFIYGGVGLGKTHLIQSIGNELTARLKNHKVKYVSAEKFVSGIVAVIRKNENRDIEAFKALYRDVDTLIVDDIQFFAGKEKSQEEFFHLFNSLYEKNKQIILSSDRPPKAIPSLEERLRSRFEGGMIADIGLPDFETRMAILKTKTQEKKVNIKDAILEYIASNIQKNVRELEGAVNRIVAYQKLNNRQPDLEAVKTLLKNTIFSPVQVLTSKKVLQTVAEFYDLREADLLSVTRKKEIVKPRQIAMYLLREELKSSFPAIGRRFGGKDHTTAIHAYEKVKKEIEVDEKLSEEIILLKQKVLVA